MNTHFHNHISPSYSILQKQLDQEHRRLLAQREQILSKQSQKLQLYEKIDLVEFFNYQPSELESSKKQIMYHLSEKFKNYMRKFTQNNVYKKVANFTDSDTQRQRSVSKSQGKTNVQKNSDLGRMFQVERNQNTLQSKIRIGTQKPTKNPQLYDQSDIKQRFSLNLNQGFKLKRKLFDEDQNQLLKHSLQNQKNRQNNHIKQSSKINFQNKPEPSVLISAQQLSHALDQQQKIYLLSELNFYIKLYKQSQTKKQFMSKHLNNLHEYLVDVRLKYDSNNKVKSKIQSETKSYSILIQQNQLLKKQIQIYKKQIQSLNRIENQDFYDHLQNNHQSPRKCIQVKKIDRFKQFAEHIQIMQDQLAHLIKNLNNQPKLTIDNNNLYIKQLQKKVEQMEDFIYKENEKKQFFLAQVKRFKEIMSKKDQQIKAMKQKLISYQQKNQYLLMQSHQPRFQLEDLNNFSEHCYTEKSNSKTKYLSPRNSLVKEKKNPISNRKEQFDRFIDSALNNTNKNNSQHQLRYSRITKKQPSETAIVNYDLEITNKNRTSVPYQHINQKDFDKNSNRGSQTTYHSRMIQKSPNITQRSRNTSRSKSKRPSLTSSRSRSRTNFIHDYEPRPYERYNHLSQYTPAANHYSRMQSDTNPLYSRIEQVHRNYPNNHF